MKNLKACLLLYVALSIITGMAYPLAVTVAARTFFRNQAEGSLVRVQGEVRGSRLIGQKFSAPAYFWSRPSAGDYSAVPSAASNLGPTSAQLQKQVEERKQKLAPYFSSAIPADLLLASGSGLDPHLSPEAALAQVDHVVQARGLKAEEKQTLIALVKQHIEPPQWRVFGGPRVNVLLLNLALDSLYPPALPKGTGP
jgi:potassium-transporting ATPase KdpC subunit